MKRLALAIALLSTPAMAQPIQCNTAGRCEVQQPGFRITPQPNNGAPGGIFAVWAEMRRQKAEREARQAEAAEAYQRAAEKAEQERRARMIGLFLKDGRCDDAMKYAFESGDLELAQVTQTFCPPKP